MKKNWLQNMFIVIGIAIPMAGKAHVNFEHEIMVVDERAPHQGSSSQKSVSQHTPPAPYDNVTFTITAPARVCVGQKFAIDYAIQISKFTHVSFWSDLIPDHSQGVPIKLLEVVHPTLGKFTQDSESIAKKGGNGIWLFPKGLPAGSVQHLKLIVEATAPGFIKFATIVATNPPFYIANSGTLVSCHPPVAGSIHVYGKSGETLEFSILDYVVGDSELRVTSVTSSMYGSVRLNEDYTISYTSYRNFYGNDTLGYTVTDAAGNEISGKVLITIEPTPIPQIIQ